MWRSRPLALAIGTAALLGISGCDADDHPNDPRPPSPVELTAKIDDEKVVVSPGEAGAGIFNITISNQSDEDAALTFTGPIDRSTPEIGAGNVLQFKVSLEQGNYEVSTGDESVKPGRLKIGPERESSQNQLLLP